MSLYPVINRFDGTEYAFLSNFYPFTIEFDGHKWSTSEHAYQAMKMTNKEDFFKILKASTPAKAKRLGNTLPKLEKWDKIKVDIMQEILRVKFSYPEMKNKLLSTGNSHLEEGNTWGDKFWGTVNGKGQNMLGKLLMKIRKELENG